ncbi:hypothetical protein [Dactylosporangium matsuzakiense]|uniref:hypothetical protein n=1 Tax=Dactylosporangium matsuzakiense TaxID=53360 RepID=UPI0021C3331E|nr:hypothetical protein [Dactylosporangium matsuzakiense]UWZ44945.1 hypothetical protein Dmats_47905 [Dactylosporangium matsuzakiense]
MSRRRAAVLALAAVLLATLSAGSCAPHNTPAPAQTPDDDVSYEEVPTGNPNENPRERLNVVPVPKGTSPRGVEFSDAGTGYALFSSCVAGGACQVGLVITLDGGYSWVNRKLPFDDAIDVDMRLGRGNVLIIKAAPDGYFISRDTGRTFERRPLTPPPVELNLADQQYSVGCQDTAATGCPDAQPWIVGDDGSRGPLPSRPSGQIEWTGLTAAANGTLWLAGRVKNGASPATGATVGVWSSTDKGRTWKAQGTAQAPPAAAVIRPVVTPDNSDVWLVGPQYAAEAAFNRDGAVIAWTEASSMREVAQVFNAEVLPNRRLLVASGQGVWVVDSGQRVRDTGARLIFRLRRLDATTILGYPAQQSGDVWLCTIDLNGCDWAHVGVSAR